jgi:hypothetical protein
MNSPIRTLSFLQKLYDLSSLKVVGIGKAVSCRVDNTCGTSNIHCMCLGICTCSNSFSQLSLYRSWRPLGLRDFEAPTFSDIRLTDGGKVVSPTRRPLFTPRKIVEPRAIVRLEGLGKLKKSTLSGTQTGNLPVCSIVPQPTTQPRAPAFHSAFP